ncbi:MAG: EpsG family protein [Bacteroidales bacterium]|nr:EpsG family protein [Bacteroidales bacterium]
MITYFLSVVFYYLYRSNPAKKNSIFLVLSITIPSVVAGCRDMAIGTDTEGYMFYTYLECKISNGLMETFRATSIEKLYTTLMWIACRLVDDFNFCLFATHLVLLSFIYKALNSLNTLPVFSLLCFYLCFFNETLNIIRQYLALAVCLFSTCYLIERKYLKVLFWVGISYLFHHSSLVFLILVGTFFVSKKNNFFSKTYVKYLVCFVLLIVFFNFYNIILQLSDTGIIEEKYMTRYATNDVYKASFPLSLFCIDVFNFVMFILLRNRVQLSMHKDGFVVFSEYILLLSALSCFLGLISVFAVRLGLYFRFVGVLYCIPHMLKSVRMWNVRILIGFYIFYWYMVYIIADLSNTYPYTSSLLGIE